jgi:hypothetical protein
MSFLKKTAIYFLCFTLLTIISFWLANGIDVKITFPYVLGHLLIITIASLAGAYFIKREY